MVDVPCVRLGYMTAARKKAYVLADNKSALNAGWDEELLALELQELLSVDSIFDIDLTGFTIAEADGLIEGLKIEEPGAPEDDLMPAISDLPAISQLGDICELGRHRLICGDALSPEVVNALKQGKTAQMACREPKEQADIDASIRQQIGKQVGQII